MNLSHSPADILRWLLINLGSGNNPAVNGSWPVFAANEPSDPDNCITTYTTAGRILGRSMVDGSTYQLYGTQVRIRAADEPTGYAKANALEVALAKTIKKNTVSIGTSTYLVWCMSGIGPILCLGSDRASKRKLYTINAYMTVRKTN